METFFGDNVGLEFTLLFFPWLYFTNPMIFVDFFSSFVETFFGAIVGLESIHSTLFPFSLLHTSDDFRRFFFSSFVETFFGAIVGLESTLLFPLALLHTSDDFRRSSSHLYLVYGMKVLLVRLFVSYF